MRKRYKRHRRWEKFGCACFYSVWFLVFFAACLFIKSILPHVPTVLATVSGIFLGSCISRIIYYVLMRIFFKEPTALPTNRIIKSAACAHLREYYGLTGPYLITKCYASDDNRFSGKDVCLFFADGELRITVDIVNGFLHGTRDMGCYAFAKEEITVGYAEFESKKAATIKGETVGFLLGKCAKRWIETEGKLSACP